MPVKVIRDRICAAATRLDSRTAISAVFDPLFSQIFGGFRKQIKSTFPGTKTPSSTASVARRVLTYYVQEAGIDDTKVAAIGDIVKNLSKTCSLTWRGSYCDLSTFVH